jgi:hypothetical protein
MNADKRRSENKSHHGGTGGNLDLGLLKEFTCVEKQPLCYISSQVMSQDQPNREGDTQPTSWISAVLDLKTLSLFSHHATNILAMGLSALISRWMIHQIFRPGFIIELVDYVEEFFLAFLVFWFMYQVGIILWNARVKPNGTHLLSLVA